MRVSIELRGPGDAGAIGRIQAGQFKEKLIMGLELFMLDGRDFNQALNILLKVRDSMPANFFSRLHLCSPQTPKEYVAEVGREQLHRSPFGPNDPPAFNRFCLLELPKLVTDTHFMIIHRDGHPINPKLWDPDFLQYDYIGAPWPQSMNQWTHGHRVGNGGFCIRSRRLAMYASLLVPGYDGRGNEDVLLCCALHSLMVERGFGFAPPGVAARFSIESRLEEYPDLRPANTFGFHGPIWQNEAKKIFNAL
jgi:hypothetical protein